MSLRPGDRPIRLRRGLQTAGLLALAAIVSWAATSASCGQSGPEGSAGFGAVKTDGKDGLGKQSAPPPPARKGMAPPIGVALERVPPGMRLGTRPAGFSPPPLGTASASWNAARFHYVLALVDNFAPGRGRKVKAAIFDRGAIFADHREFFDGVHTRVDVRTSPPDPTDNHPTQVASIMAARGADRRAVGVAQELGLLSFWYQDWPFGKELDDLEKVANEVQVSNHSYVPLAGWRYYGQWVWYGDPSISRRVDARYGKYTEPCRHLDDILYKNRHLVTFVAAGNERMDESGLPYPVGPTEHLYLKAVHVKDGEAPQADFEPSTDAREPNNYKRGGLDTIPGLGVAKNALCIGATDNVTNASDFPQIAAYSSWGPVDDGRIKPDLVAMGQDVYAAEAYIEGDPRKTKRPDIYAPVQGTSFATPTAAGIGALLVEVFETNRKRRPTSAEIKAVLIHTAIDAGKQAGPDPEFGWGVINALEAGRVIATEDRRVTENRLMEYGEVRAGAECAYTFPSSWATGRTIRATLVWTDPPGEANDRGLDDDKAALVNDLDLELVPPGGKPYHPYRLDHDDPLRPARTDGANRVDNVEVIDVAPDEALRVDPGQGNWTAKVLGTRIKPGAAQAYALIVSGVEGRPAPPRRRPLASEEITPARGRWRSLGPHGLGGPTRDLAVHPDRPRTLWAACSNGGVWKSEDSGANWSLTTGPFSSFPACTIALDPTDPHVIYAGTGDGSLAGYPNGRPGVGILKSRDAGRSWARLPATTGYDFRLINRLAISFDGQVLLVATTRGLFRSEDGGGTFAGVEAPLNDIDIVDVKFHPTDSSRCVAGGRVGRAYVSADGGAHWRAATGVTTPFRAGENFSGRVDLAYARATPSVVYALVDRGFGYTDLEVKANLYRSEDGGRTYSRGGGVRGILDDWFLCPMLWAGDPQDASVVLAGCDLLNRSLDGGRTFREVTYSDALLRSHLEWRPYDQHVLLADPAYGARATGGAVARPVYFGSETGIHRVDDILEDKPRIQTLGRGYDATGFFGSAGHAASGRIIGGTLMLGTLGYTPPSPARAANSPWEVLNPGFAGRCAMDPDDPALSYGQYTQLMIYRAGGKKPDEYESIQEFNFILDPNRLLGQDQGNFKAPFILDPNDPDVMLAGGARLYRQSGLKRKRPSELAGDFWPIIKPSSGANISAIAVPKGGRGSRVIWTGHNDGALRKTTDGGKTWERMGWKRMGKTSGLPGRECTRIAIDPRDDRMVYATFDGDNPGNVWKTIDDGATWRDISGSLPAVPVRTIAIHPDDSRRLYLGNDLGVYISIDGGANWSRVNEGPANVAVSELFWMGRTLVAATLRGVYQIDASEIER
jgi:photosystem II stability/assembly factor-like uncharacterized protein